MTSSERYGEAAPNKFNIQMVATQGVVIGDYASVVQNYYGPSPHSIRTQNLNEIVVQIRTSFPQNAIVGTGFIVSAKGKIVTCASVLRAAGLVDPRNAGDKQVTIYFPQVRDETIKSQFAKVDACFSQNDDDLVLLQLIGDSTFISLDRVAILGDAKKSSIHSFRSYGFSSSRRWTDGVIQGEVDPPEGKKLLANPLHLLPNKFKIDRGMSGAPVLDTQRNLVVGIVTQAYAYRPERSKDQEIAWAVNASALGFEPFNQLIHDEPWSLPIEDELKINIVTVHTTIASHPGVILHEATPPLVEWVGREELLKSLDEYWTSSRQRVAGLIGFGGEGKSGLARRWIDVLQNDSSQTQPDGIFWWNFYASPSVDIFFEAVLAFLWNEEYKKLKKRLPEGWANMPVQLVGAALSAKRYLFVLDGLEEMQRQEGDQYGALLDERMRRFLRYFATLEHNSFCLLTSRAPIIDLINYTTYIQRDVDRLSNSESLALLRQLGAPGTEETLSNITEELNGYALSLSLVGTRLAKGESIDIHNLSVSEEESIHYDHISRILHDEHLTDVERMFLIVFSTFRKSVTPSAFQSVFRKRSHSIGKALFALNKADKDAFSHLIKHLTDMRILRRGEVNHSVHYTIHVLIRDYYQKQFDELPRDERQKIYKSIGDHYAPDYFSARVFLRAANDFKDSAAEALGKGNYIESGINLGICALFLYLSHIVEKEVRVEGEYYYQLSSDCK